jgi:transcriptional regulator with XRE-family HTH domain
MTEERLSDDEPQSTAYGRRVGERLRSIRRQKRLSLQDVEANSLQEFKASVLGAYGRGERAISVPRLQRLARFYNVPVDQLLPADEGPEFDSGEVIDLSDRRGERGHEKIAIDLTRLDEIRGPDAEMLARYLSMIQVQRQDFNGRVLTVRADDVRAIACILDVEADQASAASRIWAYACLALSVQTHAAVRRGRRHIPFCRSDATTTRSPRGPTECTSSTRISTCVTDPIGPATASRRRRACSSGGTPSLVPPT